MKNKFLLSLSLMALCLALFADRASAIGITTTAIPGNDIPLRSVVQGTPPGTVDELGFPFGVDRFSPIETSASQPNLLANQTLRMMNGGNAATIRGKGDIVNNAVQVGDFTTTAQSEFFLSFTLTEPVNFTLDIDFSGTSTPGAEVHQGTLIYNFSTIATLYISDRFAPIPGDFLLRHDVAGTLLPGSYEIEYVSWIASSVGGTGFGSFSYELRMESFPKRVPDAGSSLVMLGMALTMLGGMARLSAVCFKKTEIPPNTRGGI